jgi:hypothetical protein
VWRDVSLEATLREALAETSPAQAALLALTLGTVVGAGLRIHRLHAWRSGFAAGERAALIERDPVVDGRVEA